MIRFFRLLPFGAMGLLMFLAGIPLSLSFASYIESTWDWGSRYPTFMTVVWMLIGVAFFVVPIFSPRDWRNVPNLLIGAFWIGLPYFLIFGDDVPDAYAGTLISPFRVAAVFLGTLIFLAAPYLLLLWASMAKETETFRQWFSAGRGGNARWAGPLTYHKHIDENFGKDGIFLGSTLIQDTFFKYFVSTRPDDDSHHLTLAATGAGKSVTCIWPTLKRYQGPMVVLDPKGEHAVFNKDNGFASGVVVTVLDPFGQTVGKDLSTGNYNPLSEINIHTKGARAFLTAISSACVMDDPKDAHFSESAKTIIEGLIALVLATRPKSQHNLPYVVDLLRGFDDELGVSDPTAFDDVIAEMTTCDAAGGLPMDAAGLLLAAADRERGSMLTTCYRSLKWINDPAMRKHLSDSQSPHYKHLETSLRKIVQVEKFERLFIILPFEYMEQSSQIRWMRMMLGLVSVHLFQNPRTEKEQMPLIIVMDEFFKLGYMPVLEEGVVTARGAGAKWWILLQDIGQLKSRFKTNWETFLGSSNIQIFGTQDQATIDWVSNALGGVSEGGNDKYPLMRPDEVRNFLGKESPKQIIIPTTGLPMRLERLAYKPIKRFRGLDKD